MTLATRLVAVVFAAGSLFHTTGLLLLAWGIAWYGPAYPAWRHATMAAVDASIACVAIWKPTWLRFVLPAFAVEQILVNGFGLTPAIVLVATMTVWRE